MPRALLVALLALATLPGCDLCWVRGEAMGSCPGDDDDDTADDDDVTGDDDTAPDDDTTDDDDTGPDDDDTGPDDDDATPDDDDATPDPCDGAPTELVLGAVTIPVVCVEPGTFFMGSPPSEEGRSQDEDQHRVNLTRAFLITTTEVTQGAFLEVSGYSPANCTYGCGDDYPVQSVTWMEALEFGNALSARTGQPAACVVDGDDSTCDFDATGWRLPTEAEWEYAARGGVPGQRFSGSDVLSEVGWCTGAAPPYDAHPVGELQPNAWGLYDMTGNVSEWTWDHYGDYPQSEVTDPVGPASASFRTFRGGAFPLDEAQCRVAHRASNFGATTNWNRGFRVVRTVP